MLVFVYEHLTGGGACGQGQQAVSLCDEGWAMLHAVSEDLARVPGVSVTVLRDRRLPYPPLERCREASVGNPREKHAAFRELAGKADRTLVIAPEFDGILLEHCRQVESVGGQLLGPRPEFVEIASDKAATGDRLAESGVPTPEAVLLQPGERLPGDFSYPAVLKPIDGAGSLNTLLIANSDQPRPASSDVLRLERFCPGIPASVAMLCGPDIALALPPLRQNLSDDGRFTYQGGEGPLPEPLARRAARLAGKVVAAMPPASGYIGIDLVLAEDDAAGDVVIEVNPRLTTSYVGLRQLMDGNLGGALLAVAEGRGVELSARGCRVKFAAGGTIVHLE